MVDVAESSLAFGTVGIGTMSPERRITVNNTGTAPLTVTRIAVDGGDATLFTASRSNCVVPVGGSCTVDVAFAPTSASGVGQKSALVRFTHNSRNAPGSSTVTLSGTAVVPAPTPVSTTPGSATTVPTSSVPSSVPSTPVAPDDRMFVPLEPARVLDTRGDNKVGSADGKGAPLTLSLFGRGGLPNGGISAVALNVTVVDGGSPTIGGGYVTVYPCGTRPEASSLNFSAGQTIPNSVIAPVSAAGTVCFYVYGTAHLLADVSGYFPAGSGFTSLVPTRVMDTRGGAKIGNAAGTGAPATLSLFGRGGLPDSGIGAVALNVTVVEGVNPTLGGGYVTVYPCGTRPEASSLNFTTGQTIPNSVIAPVSATGTVCFYVYGTAHLLADVAGYLPAGSGFTSLVPARVMDTRGSAKVGNASGTGTPFTLSLSGRGGLPAGAIDAVALNVTVVDGENPTLGGGYVTVYPCGTRPDASSLNFATGQTIPNSVIAPVSAAGTVCFYVYGTAHLLADVSGYFSS